MNVLLINAHQRYEGISEGRLNQTLMDVIIKEFEDHGDAVRTTYIEKGYTPEEEVEKHTWADLIITQTPVYWFAAPWIYKKYIDEVFTAGLFSQTFLYHDGRDIDDPSKQYGTGGKMQGKRYMLSLTWNAPKEAFNNPDQYLVPGKSVDDVFLGNTTVYKFCGASILPSYSCFDMIKNTDVDKAIRELKDHLHHQNLI